MKNSKPLSKLPVLTYRRYAAVVSAAMLTMSFAFPALADSDAGQSWVKLQKTGSDAIDANKYWIAEPTLKEAVVQAGSFGSNDLRLAKSLGELGRLYTIRGRFDEAEPYLEEELHIKQQVLTPDSEELVPSMGSLVTFYLNYGTASKAVPLTEELLAIVEGKMLEAHQQTSGKIVLKKGVPLEGWAGEAAATARDPLIEWAITCDALGNVYRLHKNYDMAERLFKAALDVKSTVLGKEHLSLANSYDSLGMLCMERNEYGEAESYLKDSLAMTEKILPKESPQVYSRLDKLAKCLIKAGKTQDAEDLYARAQSFWKDEPSRTGDDARAAYALGSLYCDEKKYEQAEPVLKHALELSEDINGPDSAAIVPYLQRYAYVLYYLGRKPEMEQFKSRANTIVGVI